MENLEEASEGKTVTYPDFMQIEDFLKMESSVQL